MAAARFDIHYRKVDFRDLQTLENTCNKHEIDLRARIVQLDLAKNRDGEEGTGATYEAVATFGNGGLIFVEYSNEKDANNKATGLMKRANPVFPIGSPDKDKSRAKVMLGNAAKNILVFRKK